MVDFTVAIPTYNGESRLPRVLDCLRSQIGTDAFSWEVIVVDNNSTDGTAQVVKTYQTSWPQSCPLRYGLELKQGAAFARLLAVRLAQGALIGFLDDDNFPSPHWVAAAYAFAQAHPQAGAIGSQIHAIYEVPPPDNFDRIAPFLAITQRGSRPRYYDPRFKLLPPSAGLVVRRQAWLEQVSAQPVLAGRCNGKMLGGEDLEAISYIQQAGWEVWYNPAMEVDHQIPHWRLERPYLLSLFWGAGLSRHVIRMLGHPTWRRPIVFLAYLINDLRKIVLHLLHYRTQVRTDLVAACEMRLYLGSLISPFYLWYHRMLTPKADQPASDSGQSASEVATSE